MYIYIYAYTCIYIYTGVLSTWVLELNKFGQVQEREEKGATHDERRFEGRGGRERKPAVAHSA